MPKTFVVGDTHFYDENILHFCDRPFKTVEEMNNYMVFRWNELVSSEDTVIVNGDFACGTEEELVEVGKCLKGKKVLVRGNHDTMPDEVYYAAGFDKVYDYPILVNEFFLVSHEPLFVQRNGVFANVFAHVHDHPAYVTASSRSYCTSVERNGYVPVEMGAMVEAMKQAVN